MWKFIDDVLMMFKDCFKRSAAHRWFVIITSAFIVRNDRLGLTSVIRDLLLSSKCYEKMIHFFKAQSYDLKALRNRWAEIIADKIPKMMINDHYIFVIDGVKQSKEGRRMPCVKKMVQQSETQSKPSMIFGHLWGGLGIMIGNGNKLSCLLLSLRIHDGLNILSRWCRDIVSESHVLMMIRDSIQASKNFDRDIYLLADRYFLSSRALRLLDEHNGKNESPRIDIITKAKRNTVAYKEPERKRKKTKGRPKLKGEAVKLLDLFKTKKRSFLKSDLLLYGRNKKVSYYCIDLLWGSGYYRKLRFVLVEYDNLKSILVSSDLNTDPSDIIRLYSLRFRIESSFREMKQVLGGFCYRFWSKSMPKLNHFKRKKDNDPLEDIEDEDKRKKIIYTYKAYEMYGFISTVAMGLVQILSVNESFDPSLFRYQRTPVRSKPSEANMVIILRNALKRSLIKNEDITVMRFIKELM